MPGVAATRVSNSAGDLREGDVGIGGDQRGAGIAFGIGRAHDHDAGVAVGELAAVARIGEEGELVATGARQRRDPGDAGVSVAVQFQRRSAGPVPPP